jgi:hypothetical protein
MLYLCVYAAVYCTDHLYCSVRFTLYNFYLRLCNHTWHFDPFHEEDAMFIVDPHTDLISNFAQFLFFFELMS